MDVLDKLADILEDDRDELADVLAMAAAHAAGRVNPMLALVANPAVLRTLILAAFEYLDDDDESDEDKAEGEAIDSAKRVRNAKRKRRARRMKEAAA